MIQQITRTVAPQNTKASRAKDSKNAFESLMQAAALDKTSNRAAQPDSVEPEKKEDSSETAVSTASSQQNGAADVSLLAQLLPVCQVPFEASGVQPQAIPGNPLLPIDTVQQPAASAEAAAQQVQTQTTATAPFLTADAVQ